MIHGSPALFYAMENCSIEIFMALLDSGASTELANSQGQTAILAAIQSRKENAINVDQSRLNPSCSSSLTPLFRFFWVVDVA
jgi:ankyrin repeat protein